MISKPYEDNGLNAAKAQYYVNHVSKILLFIVIKVTLI